MQRKIGAYIRVSTDEQANAIEGSLDNQRYRIKAHVDGKNLQEKNWGSIVDFYVDDGFSAKDTNRPAYQRMVLDLKKNKIDLILVADLSRLSRNLFDFCGLLEFLDGHKASFLSIKEQFDTSTPIGRMIIYIIMTLAQFEREQTSERVSLGVHSRAMRGLLNGGRSILGFDKDPNKPGVYVVNEEESQLVRQIFDVYLEEGSKSKAISMLNEINLRPKVNSNFKKQKQLGEWTLDSLGNILSNAAYIGFHEVNKSNKTKPQEKLKPYQRYQLVKASWPAIIDEHKFYSAQDQLEDAKALERTRLKNAEERVFLLSGVFKCAECGSPLVGATYHGSHSEHRYYTHTTSGSRHNCKVQRIWADEVEAAVLKHLKEGLVTKGYFKGLQQKIERFAKKSIGNTAAEIMRVKKEISDLETEAVNVFKIQTQGNFSAEAIKMISERLESISKQKALMLTHLLKLEGKVEENIDAAQASDYIKEKILAFESGFRKSTPAQRKRLVRKTIQQIALKEDSLVMWFFLSDDDEVPGRKLTLVRDESHESGLCLVNGFENSAPNRQVPILVNGRIGEGCAKLLETSVLSVADNHSIVWTKDNIDLQDLAIKRWVERLNVKKLAAHFNCGRTTVIRKIGYLRKNPDLIQDGVARSHIKSRKYRFMGS